MLVVHLHPFASHCQKALVVLYELDVRFETHLVEGEAGRAEHLELWAMGGMPIAAENFSLADCSAAPALFYTRAVHRWDEAAQPAITAYHRRLLGRPSFARVLDEARPYRDLFPPGWPADMDALEPVR